MPATTTALCPHAARPDECREGTEGYTPKRADLLRERTRLRLSARALLDALERRDAQLPGYLNDLESAISGEEVFDGSVG